MVQAIQDHAVHAVTCWHCGSEFDLLTSTWCGCGRYVDRPSKVCPNCLQCACAHPDYETELFWGSAPGFLRQRGFDKLFYLYL